MQSRFISATVAQLLTTETFYLSWREERHDFTGKRYQEILWNGIVEQLEHDANNAKKGLRL